MRVRLDKIASATKNAQIAPDAVLTPEIPAKAGIVIAVRVHGTKSVYNTVEDLHGRMIRLDDGDLLAGVLGPRRALRGYAGTVPTSVKRGDRLHILNLGGVIGKCTSTNIELGPPLEAEVLGAVLSFPYLNDRRGVPADIRTHAVPTAERLAPSAPLILVAGTCMSAGKTLACGEIIRQLTKRGRRVAAAKLTGVSLLRDTLSMADRGAFKSLSFNDCGIVSTDPSVSVPVAKGVLNALNREEPDVIVVELGDGILGRYGVAEILSDPEITGAARCRIMCAPDQVAVWGAVELCKSRFSLQIDVVCGPATDNAVGQSYIEEELGIKALNARLEYEALGRAVDELVFAAPAPGKVPA